MTGPAAREAPRAYANPYVAGVALGLVLLSAFVIAGRGLGASGAFATTAATLVERAAPGAAKGNEFFTSHLDAGGVLRDWLVVEILGALFGGFISAAVAGRLQVTIERGPRATVEGRLALAGLGGAVMGTGAVFARGCTSGQALTGGALLSVGSWLFVAAAFASAYLVVRLLEREWT